MAYLLGTTHKKYFCNQHEKGGNAMVFVKVDVTQPVAGNPNVPINSTWRCPNCGHEMDVLLVWNAEKEVML